jgi:hypothetical protein
MTDAATYTIRFPITTCKICGERDWRHVSVFGAQGEYCRTCAGVAMLGVARLRAEHTASCWKTGVFRLTPMWEPTP